MEQNNVLGIVLSLITTVLLVLINIFFKFTFGEQTTVNIFMYNFYRGMIGLLVMIVSLTARKASLKDKGNFTVSRFKLLVFRGLAGFLNVITMIMGMSYCRVSTFSSLSNLWPVTAIIFASFYLKEPASKLDYIVVVGSLLSSLLVTKPFSSAEEGDSPLGIASTLIFVCTMTVSQVINRQMNGMFAIEAIICTQCVYSISLSLIGGILLFPPENQYFFSLNQSLIIACFIVFEYFNNVLIQISMRVAKVSYILPIRYLTIVLGFVAGYFTGEKIDYLSIIGGSGILFFNLLKLFL